jgi:hypothetical protein
MEAELNEILASQRVPADLSITYTDMHPLWGGCMLTVRGDGHLERQISGRGATAPSISKMQIGEHELLGLVRLLIELSAWEQHTADRLPAPDESRAHLTISLKGEVSRMWEWYNEMRANNGLIRIKAWLEGQFADDPPSVPSA